MPALVLFFLADDEASSDSSGISVFFACIFLLAVVVGGAYLVLWLRRRYWGPDDSGGGSSHVGFTLGDLRHLHKSGQLSDEEFNRAKEKIVAAAQRAAERDAPTPKPGVQNPPSHGQ